MISAAFIGVLALLIRDRLQIQTLQDEVERLRRSQTETVPKPPSLRRDLESSSSIPAPLQPLARSSEPVTAQQAAFDSALEKWLARVNLLKARVEQTPGWKVPELEVLINEDWLFAVYNNPLQTDKDYQHAFDWLKMGAETRINSAMIQALNAVQENYGRKATSIRELVPFLPTTINDGILNRFELTPGGGLHSIRPASTSK